MSYCRGNDLAFPVEFPRFQTITVDGLVDSAAYAALLGRYYDFFAGAMPEAEQISIDRRFCVGAEVHHWAKGPFHDVPAYYERFRHEAARLGIDLFSGGEAPAEGPGIVAT
jgi:hypothetical protein